MEQAAIKTASKLLQKIFHDDHQEDALVYVGMIVTKEADNDTDFFLSQLDEVIASCNKLKKGILEESKPIISE